MITPKAQLGGLNYAKLRNQKKNRSVVDMDKEFSQDDKQLKQENSQDMEKQDSVEEKQDFHNVFENISMNRDNLDYINGLLKNQEKHQQQQEKSANKPRHQRVKSTFNDMASPINDRDSLVSNRELLKMDRSADKKKETKIDSQNNNNNQGGEKLFDQFFKQNTGQNSCNSCNVSINHLNNSNNLNSSFSNSCNINNANLVKNDQLNESKQSLSNFCSKDQIKDDESIDLKENKQQPILILTKDEQQFQKESTSIADTNCTTNGSVNTQDSTQFLKAIDSYLDYLTKSTQESIQQTQQAGRSPFEKTPVSQQKLCYRELQQENKIIKQQNEMLEKKLKEFHVQQRFIFSEMNNYKNKENEAKKIIKAQNVEIYQLQQQLKTVSFKLAHTREQLAKEKVEHENSVFALRSVLQNNNMSRSNINLRMPEINQKMMSDYNQNNERMMYINQMDNYNLKTDTKKQQSKKYFEGDENVQDSITSLVDEKEENNQDPISIQTYLGPENDFEDYQLYEKYQLPSKDNYDILKKKKSQPINNNNNKYDEEQYIIEMMQNIMKQKHDQQNQKNISKQLKKKEKIQDHELYDEFISVDAQNQSLTMQNSEQNYCN